MPQLSLKDVLSSWHKLVEDFDTSTKSFYSAVELGLERRKLPGCSFSRLDWNEGGVASAKREYLRITRGRFVFDVCAAPFGTAFFFSWWLVKRPARLVPLYFIGFLMLWQMVQGVSALVLLPLVLGLGHFHSLNWLTGSSWYNNGGLILIFTVTFLLTCWIVSIIARRGWDDPEAAIVAVPILGWIYGKLFNPDTYWKYDSAMMFRSLAAEAVQEAANGLLVAKGLRALTDEESKPIFSKLL